MSLCGIALQWTMCNEQFAITRPLVYHFQITIAKVYQEKSIPTFLLIDANGKIISLMLLSLHQNKLKGWLMKTWLTYSWNYNGFSNYLNNQSIVYLLIKVLNYNSFELFFGRNLEFWCLCGILLNNKWLKANKQQSVNLFVIWIVFCFLHASLYTELFSNIKGFLA